MTSTERHDECDVGEGFLGTARICELFPSRESRLDLPLAVRLVRVHVDVRAAVGEVHLGGVVAPRTERHLAVLVVERVVRDVDLTHRPEHASRLPPDVSRRVDYRPEVVIRLVDRFRSAM